MHIGRQSLPPLPYTALLLTRVAAVIAGISVVLPPFSVFGSLVLLAVGMLGMLRRSWKSMLIGLALSTLATTAVVHAPLIAVFAAPIVAWLLYRRWQLISRYWPALAQGLRMHALLVLWGMAGFYMLDLVWTHATVDGLTTLWHYTIDNTVSLPVLGMVAGLGSWVLVGCLVGHRVRLSWESTSREQSQRGGHADLSVIFAASAPIMMVIFLMPILKFDAALLATQWDDLHHALFPEPHHEPVTDSHTSAGPGTHQVRAYTRHTSHGIEHVSAHTRTNPDGVTSNNRSH